jgi:ATP-dependent RNA helicase RhlE
MSRQSFRALGVSVQVERELAARGIERPFPIQELVLPDAMAGTDVLVRWPTGSGKTLAFALPIVERIGRTPARCAALVLVPTRELALQVAGELEPLAAARDLGVAAVFGGAPLRRQAAKAQAAHVLVATPGRLQDLVERKLTTLAGVRLLVLDEADRMLDMGFRPQVERLVRRLPSERQTMLFSATLDGDVVDLARAYTRDPARFEHTPARESVEGEVDHRFVAVAADAKVDRLIEELHARPGVALVFVRTRRGADRLATRLAQRGVRALALHGDMPQNARQRTLAGFRSGEVSTLIATDVAARGLDLTVITHVINYDPPSDDNGYVHRVGRTGRAGRPGSGVTFVLPEQQADVSRLAARLGHREQFERSGMRTAAPRRVYTSRRGRNSRW